LIELVAVLAPMVWVGLALAMDRLRNFERKWRLGIAGLIVLSLFAFSAGLLSWYYVAEKYEALGSEVGSVLTELGNDRKQADRAWAASFEVLADAGCAPSETKQAKEMTPTQKIDDCCGKRANAARAAASAAAKLAAELKAETGMAVPARADDATLSKPD
jgi:hypothetical protein